MKEIKFLNLDKNKEIKIIITITIVVIILSLITLTILSNKYNKDMYIVNGNEYIKKDNKIYVYISGEVNYDGVYEFTIGITLNEVLEKIGGLTEDADISKLNLTEVVKDKQKIIIPKKISDDDNNENTEENQKNKKDEKNNKRENSININTASKAELMKLEGIGESTANKIIAYRENNEFKDIEDIMEVSGIGEAKFESIRKDITVD